MPVSTVARICGTGARANGLLNGDGPPAEDVGELDDFYIDKLTKDLYGPKGAPGVGDLVYHWQIYNGGNEADVGSPFDTSGITAEEVFNAAITLGNAALAADSGFAVPAQTYDVNSSNHVIYRNPAGTKFAAGANLLTDGAKFDGNFSPTMQMFFEINGGGTRNCGVYLKSSENAVVPGWNDDPIPLGA